MKSLLRPDNIISVFREADNSNGSYVNANEEGSLLNLDDNGDDIKKVHPYIKLERLFSWLHALYCAFFFYTAFLSFTIGLKIAKGTALIWVAFVVDLILVYFLVHTLIDLGVNPQKLSTISYIVVILRFGLSLFTRILPGVERYRETNLQFIMPVTMAFSLLLFFMALRIRRSRKGKGMFVEQSEAAFTNDRKHNLNMARFLNIIMLLVMLVLIFVNVYLDIRDKRLTDYAALKFVSAVNYLFMTYVVYRLSTNLYHLVKRKSISMIKWMPYFLFILVLIINLLVETDLFVRIIFAVLWIIIASVANAAIFYINE